MGQMPGCGLVWPTAPKPCSTSPTTSALSLGGRSPSGFSDLAPAIKRQLGPLPGDFQLSGTIGLAVPTGTHGISSPGYNPYVQLRGRENSTEAGESAVCSPRFGFLVSRRTTRPCNRPSQSNDRPLAPLNCFSNTSAIFL